MYRVPTGCLAYKRKSLNGVVLFGCNHRQPINTAVNFTCLIKTGEAANSKVSAVLKQGSTTRTLNSGNNNAKV